MVSWKSYSFLLKRVLATNMSQKLIYPAADRNKPYILDVLRNHFDPNINGNVLEIASGTGQQVSFYAERFPLLTFQPTEYDTTLFASINEYAKETRTRNIKPAIKLDVSTDPSTWKLDEKEYDYIICVNLLHVSPFNCTVGLFKGANARLKPNGIMVTYGPYAYEGVITPQSNIDFDKSIRSQNPEWGLRDIVHLESVASENYIKLIKIYDLPANNKCLVWEKESK